MVDWKKEILSKRMDIPLLPTWAFLTQRSSFSLQLDAELHRRGFGDAIPRGPELASLARPNINPSTHKLCAAGSPALLIQFHRNPPFSFSGWLSRGSSLSCRNSHYAYIFVVLLGPIIRKFALIYTCNSASERPTILRPLPQFLAFSAQCLWLELIFWVLLFARNKPLNNSTVTLIMENSEHIRGETIV